MNTEFLKGALDRAILVGITWLLTQASIKGYLSQSDVASLAPALAIVVGIGIAKIVNRPASLAAAASNTGSVVLAPDKVVAKADTAGVLPMDASKTQISAAVEAKRDEAI